MQMPTSVKDVKKTYFKYLGACIGSAMIASVYAFVDCIMVGQYEGPDGTAVLAVIMPIWTLIYAIGWLFGIGGAVLMSHARGNGDKHRGDVIFTVSNIAGISVALLTWLILAVWSEDFLVMFGADEKLLPLAMKYMKWIHIVMPLFRTDLVLFHPQRRQSAKSNDRRTVRRRVQHDRRLRAGICGRHGY